MGVKLHSFKKGFKQARKSARDINGKKYTQGSFAEAFNVSVETVKNWEQGRFTPTADTLIELCDFFDCDMDYLFGTLDCKRHNTQFIHDYTGLSEKVIERMHILNYNDGIMSTLNDVIEYGLFDAIISIKEGRRNFQKYINKETECQEKSRIHSIKKTESSKNEIFLSAKEMGDALTNANINVMNAQNKFYNIIKKMIPIKD